MRGHIQMLPMTLPQRFWSKAIIRGQDECWPWTRCKHEFGYGKISVAGRIELAHRLAWILTHGEVPPGMCVLHTCDNPPCINPGHLFLGTVADNQRDMESKGRGRGSSLVGEQCSAHKLTALQVLEMRVRFASGVSPTRLARQFNISKSQAWRICRRQSWTHLANNGGL